MVNVHEGKVIQIIGPVIDIAFLEENCQFKC